VLAAVAHQLELEVGDAYLSDFTCEARVRRSGVAKTPWSPALYRPRDFRLSARTHLHYKLDDGLLLREKLVDKTAGFHPHLDLPLDQSLLRPLLRHGSAAFLKQLTCVGHGANRQRCPFSGVSPWFYRTSSHSHDLKLGLFASLWSIDLRTGRFPTRPSRPTSSAFVWRTHARQNARTLVEIFVAVFKVDAEAFG